MKKCLIIAVFTLFYINPNISSSTIKTFKVDVKNDKKDDEKTELIYAIGMHESGYNPTIINQKEKARGFLQLRPTCVDEVNRILGKKVYDTVDCYNVQKSIKM